jgi:flagellar basal-body rod protein FlgF
MESTSLVLTSYQDVLSRSMEIVANNVANVNTTGFKRQGIQFETYLSRPVSGEQIQFVTDRATFRDTSMGPLTTTGNPLDLAIQGEGYLSVQTKDGIRYTRSGSFQINTLGEIVTPTGDKLLGDGDQPIVLGSEIETISIGSDGVVSGAGSGSTTQAGKIKISKFTNEQLMQNVGGGYYTTAQTPEAADKSHIVQGMIERSNVDSVTEMTKMIDVLRSYQQASKMLDAETQRLTDAITKLARASA